MSIRYSADTEIRIAYDRRKCFYTGVVVDPYLRFRGWVPLHRDFAHAPTSSDAYDDAARRLAEVAVRWSKGQNRQFLVESTRDGIQIRRGFQAPCPLEDF